MNPLLRLPVLFLAVLLAPLFMASQCATRTTPQATMFATLQSAAAGIDSYRTSYEAAFNAGQITLAQKQECDRRFNRANEAIIAATRALRDGQQADTPEEVDRFVRSLAELVTTLVPPKPQP